MILCDIVLVQEHWLHNSQLHVFENRIPDICAHAVSAIKDNDVLVGRPHGGVACLWRRTLACKVSPLNTNNERLCAIKLESTELTIIIVSVYMPCDTEILDSSSANVFREVLQCISDLCHSEGVDNVIMGGDFNMDFSRNRSVNRQSLLSFMTQENMTCCLNSDVSTIDYTYESMTSLIDHFIVTDNLLSSVSKYECTHSGSNMSDHSPVVLTVSIDIQHSAPEVVSSSPKLAWNNAKPVDIDMYKSRLDEKLAEILVPFEAILCGEIHCNEHHNDITNFHNSIIDACLLADTCIPRVGDNLSGRKVIPGWNEYVKEHRDRSMFWHSIWKSCDSPRRGTIADIRRQTRARCHSAA